MNKGNVKAHLAMLVTCLSFASQACRNRPEDDASLKHTEGEILRPNILPLTAGRRCADIDRMAEEFTLEKSKYVRKLFAKIVEGNPEVFVGAYAPENFCVYVEPSSYINAYAYEDGKIIILDEMLRKFSNDAQISSTLAHEISHLLMQHSALVDSGVNHHPKLNASPEWQNFMRNYKEPDPAAVKAAEEKVRETKKRRDKFIQPIRDLISPATRAIDQNMNEIIARLRGKISATLQDVAKLNREFDELQQSPAWLAMTPEMQQTAKEKLKMKIKAIEESAHKTESVIAYYEDRLSINDEVIDEEIGRNLSRYLGGILKKAWVKVNEDHKKAKEELRNLIDSGEKSLIATGSRILGFDYNPYNWFEAEADQVGLELFLKSKFAADQFPDKFKAYMRVNEPDFLSRCEEMDRKIRTGESNQLPDRGNSTHPSFCWRMINIGYTELQLHKEHYAAHLPEARVKTFFPGELERFR